MIPNVIVTVLGLLAVLLGYFFLEETNVESTYYKNNVLPKLAKAEAGKINPPQTTLTTDAKKKLTQADSLQIQSPSEEEDFAQPKTKFERAKARLKKFFSHEIFDGKDPLLTCFLYMMVGFVQVMFDEVFPLYAMLPIEDNGLNFTAYETGSKYEYFTVYEPHNYVSCWRNHWRIYFS